MYINISINHISLKIQQSFVLWVINLVISLVILPQINHFLALPTTYLVNFCHNVFSHKHRTSTESDHHWPDITLVDHFVLLQKWHKHGHLFNFHSCLLLQLFLFPTITLLTNKLCWFFLSKDNKYVIC